MIQEEVDWPRVLGELGRRIQSKVDKIELAKLRAAQHNPWFTADHIEFALEAIVREFLDENALRSWIGSYSRNNNKHSIGIICAGNIPAVGFHDVLCVLVSNHKAIIKLSSKDPYLITALLQLLVEIEPRCQERFSIVDKLSDYEAIIATGSNNSQRYFEAYFGHVPSIFRQNRTSVGVLAPADDAELLSGIAREIFLHFGLGCRNISKLFLPEGYSLDPLFESTLPYSSYAMHSKYRNNFVYHTALFQMNKVAYFTNDLLILLEAEELHSPLSVVYIEYYKTIDEVKNKLLPLKDELQVVYSSQLIEGLPIVDPGIGQRPSLSDYPDHVDVMEWLSKLAI